MAQQPSREFASTDPTTRIQDAAFQMSGVSPKISLNSRSHLQHFQRPTPSHFCKDTEPFVRRLRTCGTRQSRSFENIRDAEFSCSSFNNVTTPSPDCDARWRVECDRPGNQRCECWRSAFPFQI